MKSKQRDLFKGQKPIKTIRSIPHIIGGLLLLALSVFMLCGVFFFGIKAEYGRVFVCLFLGVCGTAGLSAACLILSMRVEVYEDGFAEKPAPLSASYVSEKSSGSGGEATEKLILEKGSVLYSECKGKIPVYAEKPNGVKVLHHYIIKTEDGSQILLSPWEMKSELTERLRLEELPVLEVRGL